jgi:prevent-host-death family protein
MNIHVPLDEVKADFDSFYHRALSEDVVIIESNGEQEVALISVENLEGLQETLYLLSSPVNAARLKEAIHRSYDHSIVPKSVDQLFEEL